MGVIWFVFWSFCISSSPHVHPRISIEERTYIVDAIKTAGGADQELLAHVPWTSILTSLPVWAIIVATFACNWVIYTVLTGLPLYFEQVLDFDLKQNGFLSALPFLNGGFFMITGGYVADFIRSRYLSTTVTRKGFTVLGFYLCAIFLVLASYAGCNQKGLSVLYITLATGCVGLLSSGYGVNHIDIAPKYSGILMGLSNTAGTVAGCITPTVTGFFTEHHPTRKQYRKVFFLEAGIACLGGLFFALAASGDLQPWSDTTERNEDDDEHKPLMSVNEICNYGSEEVPTA